VGSSPTGSTIRNKEHEFLQSKKKENIHHMIDIHVEKDRIWELTDDSIQTLIACLPDNRLSYEGNEEFWAEFFNRMADNGLLEYNMGRQKTAKHPDSQK
jgi:hypothetical protein